MLAVKKANRPLLVIGAWDEIPKLISGLLGISFGNSTAVAVVAEFLSSVFSSLKNLEEAGRHKNHFCHSWIQFLYGCAPHYVCSV